MPVYIVYVPGLGSLFLATHNMQPFEHSSVGLHTLIALNQGAGPSQHSTADAMLEPSFCTGCNISRFVNGQSPAASSEAADSGRLPMLNRPFSAHRGSTLMRACGTNIRRGVRQLLKQA